MMMHPSSVTMSYRCWFIDSLPSELVGVEQSAQSYPTRKAVGMVNALVLLITATPYLPTLYLFYCFLQSNIVMHCPSLGRGGLGAPVD
jgi:hypothetical protein